MRSFLMVILSTFFLVNTSLASESKLTAEEISYNKSLAYFKATSAINEALNLTFISHFAELNEAKEKSEAINTSYNDFRNSVMLDLGCGDMYGKWRIARNAITDLRDLPAYKKPLDYNQDREFFNKAIKKLDNINDDISYIFELISCHEG